MSKPANWASRSTNRARPWNCFIQLPSRVETRASALGVSVTTIAGSPYDPFASDHGRSKTASASARIACALLALVLDPAGALVG